MKNGLEDAIAFANGDADDAKVYEVVVTSVNVAEVAPANWPITDRVRQKHRCGKGNFAQLGTWTSASDRTGTGPAITDRQKAVSRSRLDATRRASDLQNNSSLDLASERLCRVRVAPSCAIMAAKVVIEDRFSAANLQSCGGSFLGG